MPRSADAVKEAQNDLAREVAEIRLALSAIDGDPVAIDRSLAAETAASIIERFRDSYSRLDVDELFRAIRGLSRDIAALAILENRAELSFLREKIETHAEMHREDLTRALEQLGKRFDGDGVAIMRALLGALEDALALEGGMG